MRRVVTLFLLLLTASNSGAQLSTSLDDQVRKLGQAYEAGGYHGVVLLADPSGVQAVTAFGVADQDTGRKNSSQTLFKTESTGKLFTATAVMQLVEEGRLDLQKTLEDYLPSSGIEKADQMTLHMMLTHTTGLTAPWERDGFEFREYSKEEWWNLITTNSRAFEEPGSGVYYSSSAYEILAMIVEKVSGKSFEDYCRENLLKPAGMTNTLYRLDTLQLSVLGAKPYRWVGTSQFYKYPIQTFQAGGAGGWFSTVDDFHKFMLALNDHKLVSEASLKLMMTPHVELFPGHYGYGMQIIKDFMIPGKTLYGHNGGGMGYGADLFFEPEEGLMVATMLNMYANSTAVSANFMKLLLGQEAETPVMDSRRKLFDRIEKDGLENFKDNYEAYSEELGINPREERIFITMGDSFELLERHSDFKKYIETLTEIFPESPVVWMRLGDIAIKDDSQQQAKAHYIKAQELAKGAHPHWFNMVTEKLEGLQ